MTEPVILKKHRGTNQAVVRLQKWVEDREDLRDLETAIVENAGKPLIPWDKRKLNWTSNSLWNSKNLSVNQNAMWPRARVRACASQKARERRTKLL